jgi:hypothetical protein
MFKNADAIAIILMYIKADIKSLITKGKAAGMAAAHAIKQSKNDVHKIDVQYLRKRLK